MVRRGKQTDDDDDEDDGFLYRYPLPSTSATNPVSSSKSKSKTGSGGLAPSKSTVYVSNLDYSLTNSDLHTLFSTFGKVARVTVLKDRDSRRSRGVAFVLFVSRLHASAAAAAMNGKILNGRKLTASIAADNGRASEFIRRRVYKDKSRCYECGEEGHLSYECHRNQLGPRERPVEKKQRRGSQGGRRGGGDVAASDGGGDEEEEEEEAAAGFEFDDDNWASVVDTRGAEEKAREREEVGGEGQERKRKREKKVSYFSDESGEDE